MPTVMIRCPQTGSEVSTEIETEPSVFSRLPLVPSRAHCPICNGEHVWTTRDAWLADSPLLARTGTDP